MINSFAVAIIDPINKLLKVPTGIVFAKPTAVDLQSVIGINMGKTVKRKIKYAPWFFSQQG